MSTEPERVTVTRRVAAPAAALFTLISDPNGHVAIDGSGMLVAAPDATPVTKVGDTFLMDMDREPLGDLPMGKYQVLNTVTQYDRDRLLEWTIGAVGQRPLGHVYGYVLTAVDDATTDVALYCDWTNFHPKLKAQTSWPVVPVHMLERSLVKLEELVAR